MIHHPRTPFVWSDNVIGGLVAWLYIPVLVWLANIFGSCWCSKSSIHIAAAAICMILPPVWQFTKALKGVKSFVFKKVYFAGRRLQFNCYAYDWLFRMEMIFLFQQWQVLILKLFISFRPTLWIWCQLLSWLFLRHLSENLAHVIASETCWVSTQVCLGQEFNIPNEVLFITLLFSGEGWVSDIVFFIVQISWTREFFSTGVILSINCIVGSDRCIKGGRGWQRFQCLYKNFTQMQ